MQKDVFNRKSVPICYIDTLPFIQEHNGIYDQFLVESKRVGINLQDPQSTTYRDILVFPVQFCKDIPNVSAVRKEILFLNLANLRTKPNESVIFLPYTAQNSAVLNMSCTYSSQKLVWPSVYCFVIMAKLGVVETVKSEKNYSSLCLTEVILKRKKSAHLICVQLSHCSTCS